MREVGEEERGNNREGRERWGKEEESSGFGCVCVTVKGCLVVEL